MPVNTRLVKDEVEEGDGGQINLADIEFLAA